MPGWWERGQSELFCLKKSKDTLRVGTNMYVVVPKSSWAARQRRNILALSLCTLRPRLPRTKHHAPGLVAGLLQLLHDLCSWTPTRISSREVRIRVPFFL